MQLQLHEQSGRAGCSLRFYIITIDCLEDLISGCFMNCDNKNISACQFPEGADEENLYQQKHSPQGWDTFVTEEIRSKYVKGMNITSHLFVGVCTSASFLTCLLSSCTVAILWSAESYCGSQSSRWWPLFHSCLFITLYSYWSLHFCPSLSYPCNPMKKKKRKITITFNKKSHCIFYSTEPFSFLSFWCRTFSFPWTLNSSEPDPEVLQCPTPPSILPWKSARALTT